jgi:hypothetical protein
MGSMSASDAAPLPRLGEVFFDVRGNSRSMRLSWYADTGVAVFSIWQGGMCTGTFRLAIADLPRMIETLQRGPGGAQAAWDAEAAGGTFAADPGEGTAYMPTMGPVPGQMPADFRGGQPEYPGNAPEYPGGAPEYPGDRPADPAPPWPASPDYLAEPPAQTVRVPDYLAGPPGRPAPPPEHQTEYLADLPAYRGAAESVAYQRETGRQGGYPGEHASDPYLGGANPMHYQAEPPMPHYQAGRPGPARGDAPGAPTADYPAHYGGAVSDDIGDERPLDRSGDPLPYGRHRDGR